jgi:dTDP-4-amino-4,6-dideoxygalactose transaminase
MLLSNDQALLEKGRVLREYDEEPTLDRAAFNHKMTDLQAALGISQLRQFRSFLDRRAAIAAAYQTALGQPDLTRPVIPSGCTHIFYRYVVRLRKASWLSSLLERLQRRGVHCRRPVFRPLHRYLGLDGYSASEEACQMALSIPIYPSLTDEEVARIIHTLCEELACEGRI